MRAIQLLHRFGGYQVGKTFLVERAALLQQLEALVDGDEFSFEKKRRERLVASLRKSERYLPARAVKFDAPLESPLRVEGLPDGIDLRPGKLVVDFSGPEDLLSKLYELSRTIAEDFAAFQRSARVPVSRERSSSSSVSDSA